MELLTTIDRDAIRWPDAWDTEDHRKTRHPRQAAHWYASRRRRHELVGAFCAELDGLIGRRVRTERTAAGLRQIDLAHAIGATQSTISRIESGQSPSTVADLVRIAIQLNCPLDTFITPPRGPRKTGWERHPTIPIIPRSLQDAADAGELPDDHPMYD